MIENDIKKAKQNMLRSKTMSFDQEEQKKIAQAMAEVYI